MSRVGTQVPRMKGSTKTKTLSSRVSHWLTFLGGGLDVQSPISEIRGSREVVSGPCDPFYGFLYGFQMCNFPVNQTAPIAWSEGQACFSRLSI